MKRLALAPLLLSLLACQSRASSEAESKAAPSVDPETQGVVEPKSGAILAPTSATPDEANPSADPVPSLPMTALESDLDRICNAEEMSGALELPTGDRALHTGIWLAENIETQEIRDFVAELTKLGPEARTTRLQTKLAEHAITDCEIVHTWGGGK